MSLKYSILIYNTDKIYGQMNDPDISIKVVLVDIHTHFNIKFNTEKAQNPDELFGELQTFMGNFYASRVNNCDHIFFIHSYDKIAKVALGIASLGGICPENSFYTSLIYDGFNSATTLAHELAHNFGADHDDPELYKNYACTYKLNQLMHPIGTYTEASFTISDCTIKQIKSNLLDDKKRLKSEYDCLRVVNNQKIKLKNFEKKSIEKLPGYRYSLTGKRQIRFF